MFKFLNQIKYKIRLTFVFNVPLLPLYGMKYNVFTLCAHFLFIFKLMIIC